MFDVKLFEEKLIKLFDDFDDVSDKIRGEWWIDNSGQTVYADGDVGDINHENYIRELLQKSILECFDIYEDELKEFESYYEDIKQYLIEEEILKTDDEIEKYDDNPMKIIEEYIVVNCLSVFDNNKQQALDAVNMGLGGGDARTYALKWQGYKRMKNENIETQTLTNQDLKTIYSGIEDAYGEQLEETDDPTFNIDVLSTRTFYEEVPLSVIETRDITKLNQYRTKY